MPGFLRILRAAALIAVVAGPAGGGIRRGRCIDLSSGHPSRRALSGDPGRPARRLVAAGPCWILIGRPLLCMVKLDLLSEEWRHATDPRRTSRHVLRGPRRD